MTRDEYMKKLGGLLKDIPDKEREDALRYYGDYFNDAGEGNDDEIISSLGSPEEVAELIRRESSGTAEGSANVKNEIVKSEDKKDERSYTAAPVKTSSGKSIPDWGVVLIVIGCIIGSPVIIAVAAVVFSLIVSVFAVVFSLAVAFFVIFLVLVVAAFVLLAAGLSMLFARPAAALVVLGAAFVFIAVCLFALVLAVLLFGRALPALCRWVKSMFLKIREKRAEKKNKMSLT